MRTLTLVTLMLASLAAHAEPLHLDDGVMFDAARLLAGAGKGSSGPSSSSSGDVNMLAGVGVGLQVGTPTGITFKFHNGGDTNIVLGIGAGIGYHANALFGLSLHGDYLFTAAHVITNSTVDLTAYLGPGLWLTLFNAGSYGFFNGYVIAPGYSLFGIAGRLPLGLNLKFQGAPIEVYLELDPALFVFPTVDFFVGASLGFRWFF